MAEIVTLTMNPALDVTTGTEAVVPVDKLRCDNPRYDPGGGGINVAKVVTILGGDALAVFPAGGPAGDLLAGLLEQEQVPHRCVAIKESTRQSFTVDEHRSNQQYRFVLPGPRLSDMEQRVCLDTLEECAAGARFIVASGSLPPGVNPDFFQSLADRAGRLGARFVLDTSGAGLRETRRGVYLLKPNLRELQDCVGQELRSEAEQVSAARQMIADGRSEAVVVSLGGDGALAVTAEGYERLAPIKVPIRSAVGAGDSMVAAMVLGLARGMDLAQAARFGMAAGAATLTTPGTELCSRELVEKLSSEQ